MHSLIYGVSLRVALLFVICLQNWATFEPPKTTVKRMLLQEQQKTGMNQQTVLSERLRSANNTQEQSLLCLKDHASPVVSSNKGELRYTVECIKLILKNVFVFHLFFICSLSLLWFYCAITFSRYYGIIPTRQI